MPIQNSELLDMHYALHLGCDTDYILLQEDTTQDHHHDEREQLCHQSL